MSVNDGCFSCARPQDECMCSTLKKMRVLAQVIDRDPESQVPITAGQVWCMRGRPILTTIARVWTERTDGKPTEMLEYRFGIVKMNGLMDHVDTVARFRERAERVVAFTTPSFDVREALIEEAERFIMQRSAPDEAGCRDSYEASLVSSLVKALRGAA